MSTGTTGGSVPTDFGSVSVEAPAEALRELRTSLKRSGIKVGLPVPAESPSDALDSPIGPQEVQQLLEVAVVLFNSATAAVTFSDKLLDVLRRHNASAKLTDPQTGRTLASVDANATAVDLQGIIKK